MFIRSALGFAFFIYDQHLYQIKQPNKQLIELAE